MVTANDRRRSNAGKIAVIALVGAGLVLDIAGWIVFNHRGRGLGLMLIVLLPMIVVMAVAVAGVTLVWPTTSTESGRLRPRFVVGLALCFVTAGLLIWNGIYLLTVPVCATCA